MAKQKGAAKTGGRRTGTPNRTTEQLRQSFQEFINVNIETLQTEFEKLEPEKKLSFFEKIIRHVLPPPASFEKLSEEQLKQLHEYLLKKYNNEQEGKIEDIREIVKTGRRDIFTPLKCSGLIKWDELQKLISEMPSRPIPDWMKPQVEKWGKEQETEGWKTRFAEIEANWRSYEKQAEPE